MNMAFRHKRSKNDKSSIKYWWTPLEVQSFKPDSVVSNINASAHSISHKKGSTRSETKSSSNKVSTSEFVSAILGIWDCVGQPAFAQTKESLEDDRNCQKEKIICYSTSPKHRPRASVYSENFCDDLVTGNYFSSTAKSNFENLKKIKKMLLFASLDRNIKSRFILSDSHSYVDSCRIVKEASLGVSDMADKYENVSSNEFIGKDESCILGEKSPPADLSAIQSTESTLTIEGEDFSGCQKMNSATDVLHHPPTLYSTYSVQPVTTKKEDIIVLPSLDLQSEHDIGIVTSTDWQFGECQQSTDSSFEVVESSEEVSVSEGHNSDGNCSLCHEVVIGEQCSLNHWLSIKDNLQHIFAKNRHALAGALAGTLVSLCLHPVDTVKTIIQANGVGHMSSSDILKAIIYEKGVSGLYRGIASNIASSAPISAIYTYTYESVKGTLLPLLPKEYHSLAHCIAGGCSSIATSFVFTPSERIKQQMQVGSQYQNCWNALTGCLEKGGVSSLYAGWGAVLCRNIPHSVIKFYTYESLKQLVLTAEKADTKLNTVQTLVCGGLAGSTAALVTTPFDVVKTRLQTQIPGSLAKYDGVFHALQEITRQEGFQGLYRGLTPRLAMYMSQGAIFFASYEFLKAVFSLEAPRAPAPVIENKKNADAPEPSRLQNLHL